MNTYENGSFEIVESKPSFEVGPADAFDAKPDYRQAVHLFCGEASTLAATSKKTHRDNLNRIATAYMPRLGEQYAGYDWQSFPWHQLREHHVARLVSMMHEDDKSPNTIAVYLSAVKQVCAKARKLGLMDVGDYIDIREIKTGNYGRSEAGRALSDAEVTALLTAAADQYDDLRHRHIVRDPAIIGLMAYNGLRRAEVAGIRFEDFKKQDGDWAIRVRGKGNKQRLSPITPALQRLLQPWVLLRLESFSDAEGQPVVFGKLTPEVRKAPLFIALDRWGNPIDENDARVAQGKSRTVGLVPSGIEAVVDDVVKRSGVVDSVTPHDLRRTFATKLMGLGFDLEEVQHAMGHADMRTTARYIRRASRVREMVGAVRY